LHTGPPSAPGLYGHVLRKHDDFVKKCMEYEDEGPRPRRRPNRTWREVVREDCQARKLNKEDAMDRCKWRKVINRGVVVWERGGTALRQISLATGRTLTLKRSGISRRTH